MSTRGLTIAYDQAKPPNPDAAMDISLSKALNLSGGVYYALNGDAVLSGSSGDITNAGAAWVSGRNYTITSGYGKSAAAAATANGKHHIYVNDADSGLSIDWPSGQKSATLVGGAVQISAGDQVSILTDATYDANLGQLMLTVHLEPR